MARRPSPARRSCPLTLLCWQAAACRWPRSVCGLVENHHAGFVTPRERPLLAAVDLPGFDAEDPFAATEADDSAYGGWLG